MHIEFAKQIDRIVLTPESSLEKGDVFYGVTPGEIRKHIAQGFLQDKFGKQYVETDGYIYLIDDCFLTIEEANNTILNSLNEKIKLLESITDYFKNFKYGITHNLLAATDFTFHEKSNS